MKKLFFTAIALVAFTSVSMANTISNESKEESKENDRELRTNPTCMQYASDKCEAFELQFGCMTSTQYNYMFWANYNKCLDKSVSLSAG